MEDLQPRDSSWERGWWEQDGEELPCPVFWEFRAGGEGDGAGGSIWSLVCPPSPTSPAPGVGMMIMMMMMI